MTDDDESRGDGWTDEAGAVVRRDLGAGHPLSPDTDADEGESTDDDEKPDDDVTESGQDATVDEGPDRGDRPDTAAGEGLNGGGRPDTAAGEGDSGLSRRDLLLGGVAGAVTASIGWAVALGVGGGDTPTGAEAVAVDYVTAIADNDWAAAGALFHEDAEQLQDVDSYEAHLRETGRLDDLASLTPSVENYVVMVHVPDVESAAEAREEPTLPGEIDPASVDEIKRVLAVTSVRSENLGTVDGASDFLGDTTTFPFLMSLVLTDDTWRITRAFETGGV